MCTKRILDADRIRFTMYGASAMLVITMKGGSVNGFTMVSRPLPLCGAPLSYDTNMSKLRTTR